jgi:threonine synthase
MTTLGNNIHALEIEGTFDDCQQLVKQALLDPSIRDKHAITTANSINIARLLPQIIYHAWGVTQLQKKRFKTPPTLVVPSGNFGNLTAAIYAKRMGFSINHFVAATNINDIVPSYLDSGTFLPRPSQPSLSNAMDVGHPSNFERLLALYQHDYKKMREEITGISISDERTLAEIQETYSRTGYILDPHTAVGVAAARLLDPSHPIIVEATAHPAKFPDVIKQAINMDIELPDCLQVILNQEKMATKLSAQYQLFKNTLLSM